MSKSIESPAPGVRCDAAYCHNNAVAVNRTAAGNWHYCVAHAKLYVPALRHPAA